jgi:hypothetical protein
MKKKSKATPNKKARKGKSSEKSSPNKAEELKMASGTRTKKKAGGY